MKKILGVLAFLFVVIGIVFAFSFIANGAEIDDLTANYQQVVDRFAQNAGTMNLLVEGFKSTNPTFQRLMTEQGELQQMAKDLAVKIKALETPVVEPGITE
jgi:hypothetical protein